MNMGGQREVTKVGYWWTKGWSAPIMFYRFRCPKHGWVVDYLHGYSEYLDCPACHYEAHKDDECGRDNDVSDTRVVREQ